ncbi:MAG: divisome protein SepX/GlpR [Mycobacteriaceae bacterium]
MPSSVLWVGLVVVWLVVLMPMLINLRPTIRRTSDAALSARILHRGGRRPPVRSGPAAGHRSDPNWQPEDGSEDSMGESLETVSGQEAQVESAANASAELAAQSSETAQLVAPDDQEGNTTPGSYEQAGRREHRGGFDPEQDADAQLTKFTFRQRVVLGLAGLVVLTAVLAVITTPIVFWATGIAVVGLVGYLMYLRSQVRLERDIRRRRIARMNRSRLGVESRSDRELDLIPARLRRPGAVVLEVDDEDPIFDHLDPYVPVRAHELPRAAGQ